MGFAKWTMAIVLAGFLLTGCELKSILTERFDPAVYVVERGDSVYSIAWRNRLDFKKVIAWNGLESPYTIYPGQRLSLYRPVDFVPSAEPVTILVATSQVDAVVTEEEAVVTAISVDEGTGFDSEPLKADPVEQEPAKKPISKINLVVVSRAGLKWSWPTQGKIIKTFKAKSNNRSDLGLDIAGKKGQIVLSASDGVVVVSNTVRGYGKLLLIKHNSNYISAYMYNDRLLASEGHRVKRGEQIALMGHQVGKKQAVLHFEIRKDGEPVDPEWYLPRL